MSEASLSEAARGVALRAAAAALLGCAALLYFAQPAAAFCRASVNTRKDGSCIEEEGVPLLFWPRTCSTYAFNDKVFERIPLLTESEVRAAFDDSFRIWEDVDCGRGTFLVLQSEFTTETADAEFLWDVENESVMAVRTPAEWRALEYDPQAIALTTLFHNPNTGKIYDVDMELNAGAGEFTNCAGTCVFGEVDLRNTVTHEAGHYLGLGHSTVDHSTMEAYGSTSDTEKATLESDDRDGYCALELPEHGDDDTCETPVYSMTVSNPKGCACSAAGARQPGARAAFVLVGALLVPLARLARRRRTARAAR